MPRQQTLETARAELAAGEGDVARARLKGLLSTYPSDTEIRAALAAAYRWFGDDIQAGRWAYLRQPSSAQDAAERAAFEKWSRDVCSRLALLRWPDHADQVLDEEGRRILKDLRSAAAAQRRREERGCALLILAGVLLLVGVIGGILALLRTIF